MTTAAVIKDNIMEETPILMVGLHTTLKQCTALYRENNWLILLRQGIKNSTLCIH
jgi:hypothetical protein